MKSDRQHRDAPEQAAAAPAGRLASRDLVDQVVDELFRSDRGIPWTLGQLLLRPGWIIRRYVEHRDPRVTRPFRLALACLGAAALVLHLLGSLDAFTSGFADGVMGPGDPDRRGTAMQSAGALLFARFDLVLVLLWVPAAALALQRAYPKLGLNFAEGAAFGLYTLALNLVLFTPLSQLPLPAAQWLALALALPAWSLGYAAFGFGRPEGHGVLRALGFALLALLSVLLMLLAVFLSLTAVYAVLG